MKPFDRLREDKEARLILQCYAQLREYMGVSDSPDEAERQVKAERQKGG